MNGNNKIVLFWICISTIITGVVMFVDYYSSYNPRIVNYVILVVVLTMFYIGNTKRGEVKK